VNTPWQAQVFSDYLIHRLMTKNNIPQAGVEAGASVECQTTPVYPMLVVDRGLDVFHRNAEMLIRHDFGMTAPEDVKAGLPKPVSTVRSSVRCD